jgi:hypothetical protein
MNQQVIKVKRKSIFSIEKRSIIILLQCGSELSEEHLADEI